MAALLPSLPHLRSFCLSERLPSLSSLDFLTQLPSLTAVDVQTSLSDDLLRSLCVSLPSVQKLTIQRSLLHTEQLSALLLHFPQLRELTLEDAEQVDSLSFLEPVRGSLRSLSIGMYNRVYFTLHALQLLRPFGLTSLKIDQSMDSALAPALVQSLTPPSTLIPSLQTFDYTPPNGDGEEEESE